MSASSTMKPLVVVAGLLLLPFARAQALSSGDARCRAGLAKGLRKLAIVVAKEQFACEQQRLVGAVGAAVNCGDSSSLPADSLARIEAARTKLIAGVSRCSDAAPASALGFSVCEAPCPIDVTTYDGVVACLSCVVPTKIATMARSLFDTPPAPAFQGVASCQNALAKGALQHLQGLTGAQHACQRLVDKGMIGAAFDCKQLSPVLAGTKPAALAAKVDKATLRQDAQAEACSSGVAFDTDLASCGVDVLSEQACARAAVASAAFDLFDLVFRPHGPTPTATPSDTPTATPTPSSTPTRTPVVSATPTPTPSHPGGDANTVFVSSTTGSDSNPGTRLAPKKSIQAGINAATAGKRVCIDTGAYPEAVVLKSGVSIEGGYDSTLGWTKTDAPTIIDSPSNTGIYGDGVGSVTISDLQVFAAPGSGPLVANSYGIRIVNASVSISIERCAVTAGDGHDGLVNGVSPGGSEAGAVGSSTAGGTSVHCAYGGVSGAGGAPTQAGSSASFGATGGPIGIVGSPGASGTHGNGGVAAGTYTAFGYQLPPPGGGGADGLAGGGGGGSSIAGFGGGGSGGCGGQGGAGGTAGGGSFGLYLHTAFPGFGAFFVSDTIIRTGHGGDGGPASNGTRGGDGGDAWTALIPPVIQGYVPAAPGGPGGDGGNGGGGGGGPSIGIACVNSPIVVETNNTYELGTAGGGGVVLGPGNDGQASIAFPRMLSCL